MNEAYGDAARRLIGDLVSPPAYRLLLDRLRIRRRTAFCGLMESERWSLEQHREQQERLLRELLLRAVRTSPHYRKRLPGPRDLAHFRLDDLRHLPILEKIELQESLDEITGSGKQERGVGYNESSGSTGTPVRVYQSRDYFVFHAAETVRGLLMCGPIHPWMPRAYFWGSPAASREHRGLTGTLHDILVNILWFDAFSLRRDRLAATVRRLRAFRPALIVGYVSIVKEVARELDRPLDGLIAVQTTAETLSPDDRAAIESGFGAPVFNRYGTNEVGTVAHECERHDGLHVVMENNLVEIVGPDGQPVSDPGDEGEVLVTNLRNVATPLIRYRLGDMARLGRDGCACGRGTLRLESLLGRMSDVIVSPSGALLHSLFFLKLFYGMPVAKFRVDQETASRLRLRVVPASRYSDDVRARITREILAHGDGKFDVVWEIVDDIPRTSGGKFRVTVSHIAKAHGRAACPSCALAAAS